MNDLIESGIISDITDKLSNWLKKGFDKLYEQDIKFEDEKPVKDKSGQINGTIFTAITGEGHKVHVKILNSAGRSNLYDIYLVGDNGKQHKELHQPSNKLEDVIADFIDSSYGEGLEDYTVDENTKDIHIDNGTFETNSSRKIQITLSKVQGSEEITFGPIFSNYAPSAVYADLEIILDDDEFLNEITEEDQCFEIIPSENEFDINVIDVVQPMDTASLVIKAQFIALGQLYSKLRSVCELDCDPWWAIRQIQYQLEWILQSRLSSPCDISEILKSIQWSDIETPSDISDIVETYCCTLDLYYPNFSHEIQQMINEWLLTLRYNSL